MPRPKPLLLIILDGFGVSTETEGNPVVQARTPMLDELDQFFPFTTLQASGPAVGLPWGKAGNSEVGHLTIGSGRVIYHYLPRIQSAIDDGSFFKNQALLDALAHAHTHASRLHIAGLISSGSVHSFINHLYALFDLAKKENIGEVILHAFTDGKDAPPQEGAVFLRTLEERMQKEWPNARIGSLMGRFFAMDRDEQWDRIEAAYTLLTEGKGMRTNSTSDYLLESYKKGISDEFIPPCILTDEAPREDAAHNSDSYIKKDDALIFLNFREDSMREITHAFADPAFDKFPRKNIENLSITTMTEYQKDLPVRVAFPPVTVGYPLARVVGESGFTHVHIAETGKYAHVTYFFNGGKEQPFANEERILIPSDTAAHLDENPQMRASEVTETILKSTSRFDMIIANFANADMIGHTGNFQAAIKAVEVLDTSLGKIIPAICDGDGVAVITSDHGNIELKRNIHTGEKLTQHSMNPVPFYLIGSQYRRKKPRTVQEIKKQKNEVGGILSDVAPTLLELFDLKKPDEMTGKSLLSLLAKQKV